MSAEAILIKRLARALQKIAELSELEVGDGLLLKTGDFIYDGSSGADEVTDEVKIGINHAARIAEEALKGVVVT